MSTAISAGTVLGGRYRLEDLLDDVSGARSWRAVDTVLVRDVRICALPERDARVEAMLEAARVSARVTDPHLLRVLDADVRDDLAWVVSEWGEGRTLDQMVGRGVLPADRSAWLVREVATAVASAAQHGLAHGRLAPENVMVTASGTVRLVGFAIDATLQQTHRRSGYYPDVSDHDADLLDLAALLYAALVGRWAGASGSTVQAAPRDARGPLRPRQVRAGVPRPLDALCDRVLTRRSGLDAHQMAVVLTEYLGELAAADPTLLPVPGPEAPETVPASPAASLDAPVSVLDVAADEPDQASHDAGSHRADVIDAAAPVVEQTPRAAEVTEVAGEGLDDETQLGRHRPSGPDDDPDWYKPRSGPRPPVPTLDPVPERPLFAPDDGAPRGARTAAAQQSVTTSWGATDWAEQHPHQEWSASERRDEEPRWPMGSDRDPADTGQGWQEPQQHWLRLPLIIGLLAAIAIVVAFLLAFHGGSSPGG